MIQQNARPSNRRGAALVIALVLMLLVTAISATLIRGFYTDRRERNQSQIRVQAELLRRDFADLANREKVPSLALQTDSLDGTFRLTATENDVVVEYRDAENKLIYTGRAVTP